MEESWENWILGVAYKKHFKDCLECQDSFLLRITGAPKHKIEEAQCEEGRKLLEVLLEEQDETT